MPVSSSLISPPGPSETITENNNNNNNHETRGERDDTNHYAKIYTGRLRELMDEFNELEKTEDEFLELLREIRTQEETLLKALGDDVFVRLGLSPPNKVDSTNPSADNPPLDKTVHPEREEAEPGQQQQQQQIEAEQQIESPTSKSHLLSTTKGQAADAGKSTAAEGAAAVDRGTAFDATPKRRPKRGRGSTRSGGKSQRPPRADDPVIHNARNLEINRQAQRREQKVLARRKLEEALLAEDDDSSSLSS